MSLTERVSECTHVLGLEQFLAALVAVGVRHHLWVDAGVVTAGEDGHGHAGVEGALELVGDLGDLLVGARAKEDFGDFLFAIFLFVLCRLAAWAREASFG